MNTSTGIHTSTPMYTPTNIGMGMKSTPTSTHIPTAMSTSMNMPTSTPTLETSMCTTMTTLETMGPMTMPIQLMKLRHTITNTDCAS